VAAGRWPIPSGMALAEPLLAAEFNLRFTRSSTTRTWVFGLRLSDGRHQPRSLRAVAGTLGLSETVWQSRRQRITMTPFEAWFTDDTRAV